MIFYLKENCDAELSSYGIINEPDLLYNLSKDIEKADQEVLMVISLNGKHLPIRRDIVSMGGQCNAMCDPAILFRRVLQAGAPSFAVVHNHPSGHTNPSVDDDDITRRLFDGARVLGLTFLDHLIVGDKMPYYSYRVKNRIKQ